MGGARASSWRGRLSALVSSVLAVTALAWATDPAGTPSSRAAMRACREAAARPEAERAALLDAAVAGADAAVAADARDALAHFALFCALGERMRLQGVSVAALGSIRRLRRAVDRTLELAPDYADALAGKGALLSELPRLLGGDVAAGERLLRRAIAIDPEYLGPRFDLIEVLLAQGRRTEARQEAEAALRIAESKHDPVDVGQAIRLRAKTDAGG